MPESAEKKIAHLQIIQATIIRMATCSFSLKGWGVTLVTGIVVLADKDADWRFFCLAFVPILTFWCLDAYYLHQERTYRELYKRVAQKKEDDVNFDMTPPDASEEWCAVLLSKTLLLFWLGLALAIMIVITLAHRR